MHRRITNTHLGVASQLCIETNNWSRMCQIPSFEALKDALLDIPQPLGKRTRAVFYLRTRGQQEDLHVLLKGSCSL